MSLQSMDLLDLTPIWKPNIVDTKVACIIVTIGGDLP